MEACFHPYKQLPHKNIYVIHDCRDKYTGELKRADTKKIEMVLYILAIIRARQ